MCNLYEQPPEIELTKYLEVQGRLFDLEPYAAGVVAPRRKGVFLRPGKAAGELLGRVGQWGMIRPGSPRPKPGDRPHSTNNARVESITEKVTFRGAWNAGHRCLVPASWYAEPNWETGANIWWHLRRSDGAPWFLAGLWSEWLDKATGEVLPNYTVLTVNCNAHALLNRLHRPECDPDTKAPLPIERQDKRSPVHIEPRRWDQWLHGTMEEAMSLLEPAPMHSFDMSDAHRTDQALAEIAAAKRRSATESLF